MANHFKIVCEGKIKGLFTGFSECDDPSEPPTFDFDNGQRWKQDESFYYYFGMIMNPHARVISYLDGHYICIDATPDESLQQPLPRPVKVILVD